MGDATPGAKHTYNLGFRGTFFLVLAFFPLLLSEREFAKLKQLSTGRQGGQAFKKARVWL